MTSVQTLMRSFNFPMWWSGHLPPSGSYMLRATRVESSSVKPRAHDTLWIHPHLRSFHSPSPPRTRHLATFAQTLASPSYPLPSPCSLLMSDLPLISSQLHHYLPLNLVRFYSALLPSNPQWLFSDHIASAFIDFKEYLEGNCICTEHIQAFPT